MFTIFIESYYKKGFHEVKNTRHVHTLLMAIGS